MFLSIVIKAMFTDDIKNYMENMHIMILYIQTKDDILCQVPTKLTRYNNGLNRHREWSAKCVIFVKKTKLKSKHPVKRILN